MKKIVTKLINISDKEKFLNFLKSNLKIYEHEEVMLGKELVEFIIDKQDEDIEKKIIEKIEEIRKPKESFIASHNKNRRRIL